MKDLLIANCTVESVSRLDVRVESGLITEIGRGLKRGSESFLDADGNDVIPGLCDHHIHLHALASRRASVECGPPHTNNFSELAKVLHNSIELNGWVRGVGYFESVAGMIDRDSLDLLHITRPVRIQHRSGALWILNSTGVDTAGLDTAEHPGIERDATGRPTGRVWRADAWLRDRIPGNTPPPLKQVGDELAALGITSITDATPDLDPSGVNSIKGAVASGDLPQRVHLLGAPLGVGRISERVTVGPYKIVLADSHLPDLEELARTIVLCHNMARPIAAHCVSREALLILLAVLTEVGAIPGDRIEHGALIPAESIEEIHRLGLTVVTQPGFIHDRGDDYLRDIEPSDLGDIYRYRSLIDANVPAALSSDAPYGPLDPWIVMEAACYRRTPAGIVLGEAEKVHPSQALAGYLGPLDSPGGPARRVKIGAPGDLVLLTRDRQHVLSTIIDGRPVFVS